MANERQAPQSDIKQLISKGLEQGYLTYAEVNDHLPDDLVDPEQIEDIIGMINGMGIEVHEVAPDVDTLLLADGTTGGREVDDTAAEEAAATLTALDGEGGRTTDPVRMYMREMGTVELLTREGEIAIAKRIEEGLTQMMSALASFPWSVQLLLEEYELHKSGKKRLADIVVGFNDVEEPVEEIPVAEIADVEVDDVAEDEDDGAVEEAGPTGPDPAEVARRMEALAAAYAKFQKSYAKNGPTNKAVVKQREESFAIYVEAGRNDLATVEKEEIDILNEFLPKGLTDAEIEDAIKAAIAKTGAAGGKDMGKVIASLKADYPGRIDFGKASGKVKMLLS